MNEHTNPTPQAADDQPLQDYFERLSQAVESDDFTIGPDAVVHPGRGEQPGREFLEQFMSPAELDAATTRGRGRPSLSGSGRSPARQVRLPAELDTLLVERAHREKRALSDVLRDAVASYLRPPAA